MKTYFARPDRTAKEELYFEIDNVKSSPVISGVLESVGGLLAILNENRQILALNSNFLRMLGVENPESILGLRPGEAVQCIHAHREAGGCGTSKYCSTCGAAIAIVATQATSEPTERICSISTLSKGELKDLVFSVRAFPIQIGKRSFIMLFLQDITGEQQRTALERTFFHDLNNMIQVLVGASELLIEKDSSYLSKTIRQAIKRLENEVSIQRCLSQKGEFTYTPYYTETTTEETLKNLRDFFDNHPLNKPSRLDFSRCPETCLRFTTDQSLLWRILHNMILNALEATDSDRKVCIWFTHTTNSLTFNVWNHQAIDKEAELRIFERNFSTKETTGRGIGTFSMKYFGEDVLGGKVRFTTSKTEGTTFMFTTSRGQIIL